MTVVLCGIGADSTNVGELPPIRSDGTFEYVPIPEKSETTEEQTFGTWPLSTGETAADLTPSIRPRPISEPEFRTDPETWPLHHDPNFGALTYGEHRPAYVDRLSRLDPGDLVGFYAGLRDEGARAHRYLIGWFSVENVHLIDPGDREAARRAFAACPENAHAKRAREDGEPYVDDRRLAIVEGREPGGLVERDPLRLSEYAVAPGNSVAQYYLRESVREGLSVVEGRENMQFKPAYRCDCSAEEFADRIEALR
ncbi:Nmad3 family putative nucleotide modification protein [Natronorarus salvus]|uniref:Nmad3 family putative nucleotide modification protein n=1 Tax=Natronorarus salvus TaxID=3117733 RepID=UPI002F261A71